MSKQSVKPDRPLVTPLRENLTTILLNLLYKKIIQVIMIN